MRLSASPFLALSALSLLLGCGIGRTPAERACVAGRKSLASGERLHVRAAEMRGPFVVPDVPVPAELGARGTEGASDTMALGALTVRLLVDSLGRVMRGSVQVLDSPTPDIAEAFTVAAEGWRFRPAELAPGCTVSDDVRLRFQLRWRPGGGVVIAPVPAAA